MGLETSHSLVKANNLTAKVHEPSGALSLVSKNNDLIISLGELVSCRAASDITESR